MQKSSVKNGAARLECISRKKEIFDLLNEGHTIKNIHASMKLTCSYRQLAHWINVFKQEQATSEAVPTSTSVEQAPEAAPSPTTTPSPEPKPKRVPKVAHVKQPGIKF
jgi:hypothetical protein